MCGDLSCNTTLIVARKTRLGQRAARLETPVISVFLMGRMKQLSAAKLRHSDDHKTLDGKGVTLCAKQD